MTFHNETPIDSVLSFLARSSIRNRHISTTSKYFHFYFDLHQKKATLFFSKKMLLNELIVYFFKKNDNKNYLIIIFQIVIYVFFLEKNKNSIVARSKKSHKQGLLLMKKEFQIPLDMLVQKGFYNGFSIKELTQLLQCSESTIRVWRRFKNFPNPSGPTKRTLIYDFDAVVDWAVQHNCLNANAVQNYININTNNINNIYNEQQKASSNDKLQAIAAKTNIFQHNAVSLKQKNEQLTNQILSILREYGFDVHVFEQHMSKIVSAFKKRNLNLEQIEQLCLDTLNKKNCSKDMKQNILLSKLTQENERTSNIKMRDFEEFK